MITWGISANSHDAALAVFDDDQLLFASHSERFSGTKNDAHLHKDLIDYALDLGRPDHVFWYENPIVKSIRQLYAGQGLRFKENNIREYLNSYSITADYTVLGHHESHAAAGFYTSRYEDAAVLVIDSIGEFDTTTIWSADSKGLKKIWSKRYPYSVGLFYSAMTQRIGLKPNEEEYILMGMAAYGNPEKYLSAFEKDIFRYDQDGNIVFRHNFHKGCRWFLPNAVEEQDLYDIAATTQFVFEHIFHSMLRRARALTGKKNLVYMGGCALNCLANPLCYKYFSNVWIMPNPGDAGSSVGAVLAARKKHIEFTDCFLGYDIKGEYPVQQCVDHLLTDKIVGIANGKAEFGPRALGNRSLLADPRGPNIKDKVNEIKRRQKFRPFAPIILEEFASDYFEIPNITSDHRFMQFVVECKDPEQFPAIVHYDNTSRLQTVPNDGSGIRNLLEAWHEKTGCPMLLNTSLNIKGKPMVNTVKDAKDFETYYNVHVATTTN
jgi:carbamoyltransferase